MKNTTRSFLRVVYGSDVGTSERSNRSSDSRLSRDGRRHRDDWSSSIAEEDDLNECSDQRCGNCGNDSSAKLIVETKG